MGECRGVQGGGCGGTFGCPLSLSVVVLLSLSVISSVVDVGVYRVWSGLCDLRTDHTLPRY